MPNPWILLVAVLAIVGAAVGGEFHGRSIERTAWEAKVQSARADAAEAAREEERQKQEGVNRALQEQNDTLAAVNAGLSHDIEQLRQRPARASVPRTSPASCKAATGAQLSREDAGFLVRESARADRLRAALVACYNYADTVAGSP
jgi:hypothetical protein